MGYVSLGYVSLKGKRGGVQASQTMTNVASRTTPASAVAVLVLVLVFGAVV